MHELYVDIIGEIEPFDGLEDLLTEFKRGLAPPPDLTVSQWADQARILDKPFTKNRMRWRTDYVPYTREIMDCLSPSSPVKRVAWIKSAQLSGSETGNNWLGFTIQHNPGLLMLVTAFPLVEIDQLCNPDDRMDEEFLRGGIELDEDGEPTLYHVLKRHPGDVWNGWQREWEPIPAYTEWGRQRILHIFSRDRVDAHRGVAWLATSMADYKVADDMKRHELAAYNAQLGVTSCTIITAPAVPEIERIHPRMPIILSPDAYGAWLDTEVEGKDAKALLLGAQTDSQLEFHWVSRDVNNSRMKAPTPRSRWSTLSNSRGACIRKSLRNIFWTCTRRDRVEEAQHKCGPRVLSRGVGSRGVSRPDHHPGLQAG